MKKKLYYSLASFLFLGLLLLGSKVEANPSLFLGQFLKTKVEVNGTILKEEDVPPFIVNGRTVLPLSQVADLLSAYVTWDESRRVVVVTKPIVNMSIININRSRNEIEVNPSFKTGTHSFQVATQVSKVPISKSLKLRFSVVDGYNRAVYEGSSFTIDTARFNGSFQGNLDVAGLRLSRSGEFILKLEMEEPGKEDKFITIGEYMLNVN
jgi:hypothetical protein